MIHSSAANGNLLQFAGRFQPPGSSGSTGLTTKVAQAAKIYSAWQEVNRTYLSYYPRLTQGHRSPYFLKP